MKAGPVIIGACLFATGIFLGQVWTRAWTKTAPPLTGPATAVPSQVHPPFTSMEEAIRKAPERVLEDLANDPYLSLTDSEIAALAEEIDLTKDHHRRLLNGVMPPWLSEKLWVACLRASTGKIPIEELLKITQQSKATTDGVYLPVIEAIHQSPDRKQILATRWGSGLVTLYLREMSAETPDLQTALALIPEGKSAPDLRENVINGWIGGHPSAANLETVFKLQVTEGLGNRTSQQATYLAWSQAPEQRLEILDKIAAIPGPNRNALLGALTDAIPPGDVPLMASLLSRFSSFAWQEEVTTEWVKQHGEDGKQKLLRELDAVKDAESVRKLRAKLAETPAAK